MSENEKSCPKCGTGTLEHGYDLSLESSYHKCSKCQAIFWTWPEVELFRQLAAANAKLEASQAQAAAMREAVEGGIVIANAYFEAEGRDPSNNDNYCRMTDAIKTTAGQAILDELQKLRAVVEKLSTPEVERYIRIMPFSSDKDRSLVWASIRDFSRHITREAAEAAKEAGK